MKSSEKMSFSKALAISASQCSFGSNVGLCSFLFQRKDVTACTVTAGLIPQKSKRAIVVVCVELGFDLHRVIIAKKCEMDLGFVLTEKN